MLKLLCVMSALQLGTISAPAEITAENAVNDKLSASASTPSLSTASAKRLREFYTAKADNAEQSQKYTIKGNHIVAKLPTVAFNKTAAQRALH